MNKTFLIFSICILSAFSSSFAQEQWSLEKCISYAKENNISIKSQKLNVDIEKTNAKQAKLELLPSLNAQVGHNFSFGRSTSYNNVTNSGDQQSSNFSLSSNVSLFEGFQKWNSIKQAEINLKASLKDLDKAENDISLNITSYYLDILFKKELLKIAQEQIIITELQINRSKELVKAGTIPKGSLLEQEAQIAREKLDIINSENNLDLAKLGLAQLLDLESSKDFDIEAPHLPVINANRSLVDQETVFINALQSQPEIESSQLRLESQQLGFNIAKGQRLPSLSLGGSWSSGYYSTLKDVMSFKDQLESNESKGIGFTLRIPIFNKGQVNRNISISRIQISKAKLELQNSKNNLRKEVQQAHANAIAAMKQYFSSISALTSTEEAFRYTEEKFNLGVINSLEYNQSKTNLIKVQSEILQSKYNYLFRTKILDFYNGVPIKL